jgi:hypothetical protein
MVVFEGLPLSARMTPVRARRVPWKGAALPGPAPFRFLPPPGRSRHARAQALELKGRQRNNCDELSVVTPEHGRVCAISAGSAAAQSSAQHWRMLEAEARILVSAMTDPAAQRVMLSIAEAYKRHAVRADLQELRPPMDTASFGPEALKAIGEAVDIAWTEIADNYSNVTAERETGRLKLATALLLVAAENGLDPQELETVALARMNFDPRQL